MCSQAARAYDGSSGQTHTSWKVSPHVFDLPFFFFFKLVKHNIGNFTFDECEGRCTTFVVCSLCDTRSQPGTVLGSEDIVVSIKGWFSPF